MPICFFTPMPGERIEGLKHKCRACQHLPLLLHGGKGKRHSVLSWENRRKWQLPPLLQCTSAFWSVCRHGQVHFADIFHRFLEHFLTLLCRIAAHERSFFLIKSKHKKKISQICWSGCFPVICHLNYITTIFQTLN